MRSAARTMVVAAGLACGLVLAGCAADGGGGGTPTLPAGVSVELQQLRADVAVRQAQVQVTNSSDAPLTVGDVRVEDDRFDGPAVRVVADRVSTIPAGGEVDIRVQLPSVDCTAADDGEARVVLELGEDPRTTEVTASASDPLGFLAPLHARECLRERLTDAAAVAFTGFEPSAAGEPAALQLTIAPTGEGAATVVGVKRTNLIDFAGLPVEEDAYPVEVDVAAGDTEPIVVDLPLVPFRCDPHAVQEDKRGTIFSVRIELDGEPGQVEVFVGDDLRGEILSWVADWCGFGG